MKKKNLLSSIITITDLLIVKVLFTLNGSVYTKLTFSRTEIEKVTVSSYILKREEKNLFCQKTKKLEDCDKINKNLIFFIFRLYNFLQPKKKIFIERIMFSK